MQTAGVNAVFPLRHWTDQDVWDYTELNRVPYDKRRYQNRAELDDKWLNPDYVHACTACIDPREDAQDRALPEAGRRAGAQLGPTVVRMETFTGLHIRKRRKQKMPFTVSPAAYKGGDYLFQGITNAAQGITGAIKQYAQISGSDARNPMR